MVLFHQRMSQIHGFGHTTGKSGRSLLAFWSLANRRLAAIRLDPFGNIGHGLLIVVLRAKACS